MTVDQTQAQKTQETKKFKGRFSRNLMAVIIPLAIIPTIIMGWVAYSQASSLLLGQISEQLGSVLQQEISSLDKWLSSKETRLQNISNNEDLLTAAQDLTTSEFGSTKHNEAQTLLIEKLTSINLVANETVFNFYIFLDGNGIVQASSKEDWKSLDLSEEKYI